MSAYRASAASAVVRIPLVNVDPDRARPGMLITFVLSVALALGGSCSGTVHPAAPYFAAFLVVLAFAGGTTLALHRARTVKHVLELGDAYVQLQTPGGVTLADTRKGTLSFAPITYLRKAGNTSQERPGWAMRHPGGEDIVGTAGPAPVWKADLPLDRRRADFELGKAHFDALAAATR